MFHTASQKLKLVSFSPTKLISLNDSEIISHEYKFTLFSTGLRSEMLRFKVSGVSSEILGLKVLSKLYLRS